MRSRSCRWPPRWKWTATRINEARLALGGVAHKPWRDRKPRRCSTGQGATEENFQTGRGSHPARRKGFGHNSLQNRVGETRRRSARLKASRRNGGDNHDDHRIHRPADQPRRRARQGHRRGEVRRPSTTSRISSTVYVVSSAIAKGENHADRREPRRSHSPGVLQVFTHENAPRLAMVRPQLPRRGRAARLTVSPALRRQDSSTAANPSRWSSPKPLSWRAMRRRSCGSSTHANRMRPICMKSVIEHTNRRHETYGAAAEAARRR